jgi:hypothetical protein
MLKKISLMLVVFTFYCFAQEGGILQYNLVKGKTYKYAIESIMKSSQEMMGRENVSDIVTTAKVVLEPQEIDENGNMVIHGYFAENVTKIHSTMIDTTLDTKEMLGKKVKIVMTKLGKAVNVTAIDSFPKLRLMGAGLGDPTSTFKRLLLQLPGKELKTEDNGWTRTSTDTMASGPGQIFVTDSSQYKVLGKELKSGFECLKVGSTGKYSIEGKGSQMGADFVITGDGKREATFLFAPKEGLMVAVESNDDSETTIAVTGQMSMTIPQTTTNKTKVVLVP